jgi:hypothetical protein
MRAIKAWAVVDRKGVLTEVVSTNNPGVWLNATTETRGGARRLLSDWRKGCARIIRVEIREVPKRASAKARKERTG